MTSLHLTVCSQELKRTRSPPPKKDTVGMRGKKGFKSSKLLGQQSSFLKSELYWGGVERKPLAKNLNTATNFKVWSSPGSWEGRAGGGGVGMTQGLRVSLTVPADPECATRLGWPQSPASSSLLLLHSGIKDMHHHSSLCFCFVLRKALSVILEAINPLSSCLSFTSARIMCTTMASF